MDNDVSGFTTIGILPSLKKGEFVIALFHQGKLNIYYKEQPLQTAPNSNLISDGTLTYKLVEPMRQWNITVDSEKLKARFLWTARFEPFDFGVGSGTSWVGHFEQSGIVDGEAALAEGERVRIHGFGQRDKSWGARDWYIENWYALHAQFKSHVVGLRKDTVNGVSYVSGGLAAVSRQVAVSAVEVEAEFDKNRTPVGALTVIHYENGEIDELVSKLISPTSFLKFSRSFSKGTTELFEGMALHKSTKTGEMGTGLIELLFTHPKT